MFFNDSLVLAGTEKMLVLLLNHLAANSHVSVTLLLPHPSDENVLLAELDERIEICYLFEEAKIGFAKKWAEIKMIFSTASFIKKVPALNVDYDLIVCFKEGVYANMFVDFKIPKILWIHNIMYKREYQIRSFRERWAVWLNKKELKKTYTNYEKYNKVLCVSQACRKAYIDILFDGMTPIQDIRVVPNSVIVADVLAKATSSEILYNSAYVNFVLLTRNSPDKAPERVFQVMKQLKSEGIENAKIHIIGLTGEEDIVTEFDEMDHLQNNLVFYGNVENPYPYIQQADWLLCVSDRESFSLSVLEALVLDTPVISTNCGGPGMLLENGKLGILVANEVEALYQAVKKAIQEPMTKDLYLGNYTSAREKYDTKHWYAVVDKILGV